MSFIPILAVTLGATSGEDSPEYNGTHIESRSAGVVDQLTSLLSDPEALSEGSVYRLEDGSTSVCGYDKGHYECRVVITRPDEGSHGECHQIAMIFMTVMSH